MRRSATVGEAARTRAGAVLRGVIADALLRTGITAPRRSGRGRLTIVTFHRVLPAPLLREYPLPHLAVTPERLSWFLAFALRHYTCGTLAETHARWTSGERPERPFLAVTFDDGQADNFEHARPVLAASDVRASFFVPSDAVDTGAALWYDRLGFALLSLLPTDRPRALALAGLPAETVGAAHAVARTAIQRAKALDPAERLALVERIERAAGGPARPGWDGLMDWGRLRTLAAEGHEIGSHSRSHPILPLVDDAALAEECVGSRHRIEAELGRPCVSFCYPNGSLDDRVEEAVRSAGYRCAVTTAPGPNPVGRAPLRLSRCEVQERHLVSEARLAFQLAPLSARRRT